MWVELTSDVINYMNIAGQVGFKSMINEYFCGFDSHERPYPVDHICTRIYMFIMVIDDGSFWRVVYLTTHCLFLSANV